jgi:hypothetical protein
MMRFNSVDRRLERMLETTLMVMEAFPRAPDQDPDPADAPVHLTAEELEMSRTIDYSITGHSGDSPEEIFVDFAASSLRGSEEAAGRGRRVGSARRGTARGQLNEKDKIAVLEVAFACLLSLVFSVASPCFALLILSICGRKWWLTVSFVCQGTTHWPRRNARYLACSRA